jgi:putative ABC transport system permease protein
VEILPIISSLRRNKVGAVLIALQIALTLAIVCNALPVIQRHMERMHRPTGIDEANIFTLSNQWVGQSQDLSARIQGDLATIRGTPGVIDAEETDSFPLHGGGSSTSVFLAPEQKFATAHTAQYLVDEHGFATYGFKLDAGRWFSGDEIGEMRPHDTQVPASIVVTRSLARALFPNGSAVGKMVYLDPHAGPSRVIGVIERAQTPWAGFSWAETFIENSTFLPYEFLYKGQYYVVRTRPGQMAAAMQAVQNRLYAQSRQRVIDDVQPFAESRGDTYAVPRTTSVLLTAVCAVMLVVTILGITGLTMYWVTQRRRQIGMRRALGARQRDILRYFHVENLLIAGSGVAAGVGLGLAGNLWLANHLELARMGLGYICSGGAIVLLFSQAAVLWPALRAARVPPAAAIRAL